MNPDQMPVNSQRDGEPLGLPNVREIAKRTARKRKEWEKPFEDAVGGVTALVGEGIRRMADRGQTRFTVKGEIVNTKGRLSVSAKRVFGQVAEALREKGFCAQVQPSNFDWETELYVTWTCDTPDYRRAED